jgi:hypothetical protein
LLLRFASRINFSKAASIAFSPGPPIHLHRITHSPSMRVECADNLTEDEIIALQARLEVELCMLQRNHRGYTPDHAACQAVPSKPPTIESLRYQIGIRSTIFRVTCFFRRSYSTVVRGRLSGPGTARLSAARPASASE